MLVEGQLIEITIMGNNMQHFKDLGYDVKFKDTILVPPEHLNDHCKKEVNLICDSCGKPLTRPYVNYVKYHTDGIDLCVQCKTIKLKKTNLEKYGVEFSSQDEEVKEKTKRTNLERYGCISTLHAPGVKEKVEQTWTDKYGGNPMFSQEVKKKLRQTNLEKYGVEIPTKNPDVRKRTEETCLNRYGVRYVVQNDDVKNKVIQTNRERYGVACVLQNVDIQERIKQTNLEKYGVENPFESDEIKLKIQETLLEKYGVTHPSLSSEIRLKASQTMLKNGNVPTSKPQLELYEMVKQKYPDAKLNYPLDSLFLDIFISTKGVMIDIEYDGQYFHKDKGRDFRRDMHTRSKGIKVLRIRSNTMLPTDEELFSTIDYLVDTEHHFKEIILPDWKELQEEVVADGK